MSKYELHEDVREDLDKIWNYLAEEASPPIAYKVEEEFFEMFALLSAQPGLGFQRPRLASDALRFTVMREYLIAYAPFTKPLLIVAVIHGRQHPQTIARIVSGRQ